MGKQVYYPPRGHMYRNPSAASVAEGLVSCAHFSPVPGVRHAVLDTILEMVSIFVIPVISILTLGTAARLIPSFTT